MSEAQKKYDSLVFEGGAVLGMAYVAALEEAEKQKLIAFGKNSFSNPENLFDLTANKPIQPYVYRFAGTSIGAAFAALLACGATPAFLRQSFSNFNPDAVARDSCTQATLYSEANCLLRWLQLPVQIWRDAMRLYSTGGIWRGDALEKQFANLVSQLTGGDRDITLLQVHQRFNTDLHIVAVDINRHHLQVFSYRNEPNMPLVVAVMASMAVPILFPWVRYGSSAFVDGGVLCNYFIDAFDEHDSETGERNQNDIYPGTLGFKLVTAKETIDLRKNPLPPTDNVFETIPRIFTSIMNALHREHLPTVDLQRTIRINVHNMDAFDFKITDAKKQLMDEYGVAAITKFLRV